MSRGGPRPNSGRKSNAALELCHAQMDRAITPDDWSAIYARLVQIVKEGDPNVAVQAARLLIHQRWGDGAVPPAEPAPDLDDVCEIKFIHVEQSAANSAEPAGDEEFAEPCPSDQLVTRLSAASPASAPASGVSPAHRNSQPATQPVPGPAPSAARSSKRDRGSAPAVARPAKPEPVPGAAASNKPHYNARVLRYLGTSR